MLNSAVVMLRTALIWRRQSLQFNFQKYPLQCDTILCSMTSRAKNSMDLFLSHNSKWSYMKPFLSYFSKIIFFDKDFHVDIVPTWILPPTQGWRRVVVQRLGQLCRRQTRHRCQRRLSGMAQTIFRWKESIVGNLPLPPFLPTYAVSTVST